MKLFTAVACILISASLSFNLQAQSDAPSSPPPSSDKPQSTQQSPGAGAPSAIDPVKAADIEKLLDVTGAEKLAMQMMNEMSKNIRPLMTTALPPGAYREKLIDLFFVKFQSKADPKFFRTLALPVYNKYYSDEEIKGLIEFYSTPLGRKMLDSLPKVVAELQESGREWGQGLGRDSMQEVLAEHPDLKKALDEAGAPPSSPSH